MLANAPQVTPRTSVGHAWGAVVAMALCAGMLIASEFLPVSLLTPIASELHITEGRAGQSISISGFFALLTSLFISVVIGRTDRRRIVLLFTALAIVSGCTVTLAPNCTVLMVGRAFLGVSVGGFWSVSAAIVMRLVPKPSMHRAFGLCRDESTWKGPTHPDACGGHRIGSGRVDSPSSVSRGDWRES